MTLEQAWHVFEFPPGVERAGIPRRLLARIVDAVVISLLPVALLLGPPLPGDDPSTAGLCALVVWAVYEPWMLTRRGASAGKVLMGVRVARMDDLENPSLREALIRWACVVLFVTSIVRYVLAAMLSRSDDSERQRGLPDRAAGTVVIRSR